MYLSDISKGQSSLVDVPDWHDSIPSMPLQYHKISRRMIKVDFVL